MHLAQFLTVKILNNGHFNISINYSLHLAYFINVSKEILIKLELAKYYKDFEMTAYISERSRNSKYLKKYDSLYFSF